MATIVQKVTTASGKTRWCRSMTALESMKAGEGVRLEDHLPAEMIPKAPEGASAAQLAAVEIRRTGLTNIVSLAVQVIDFVYADEECTTPAARTVMEFLETETVGELADYAWAIARASKQAGEERAFRGAAGPTAGAEPAPDGHDVRNNSGRAAVETAR